MRGFCQGWPGGISVNGEVVRRLSHLKDRDISRISKLNDLLDVSMKVPDFAPCQSEFVDYISFVSVQRPQTRVFSEVNMALVKLEKTLAQFILQQADLFVSRR